jgi:hypothetical protein
MKLYEVPRNTKVVLKQPAGHPPASITPKMGSVYTFHHTDGMYSYCEDMDSNVVHLPAWAEVEIKEN